VRENFEEEGEDVSRFALRRAQLEYRGNSTRGAGLRANTAVFSSDFTVLSLFKKQKKKKRQIELIFFFLNSIFKSGICEK
jgi:hypothetical protein